MLRRVPTGSWHRARASSEEAVMTPVSSQRTELVTRRHSSSSVKEKTGFYAEQVLKTRKARSAGLSLVSTGHKFTGPERCSGSSALSSQPYQKLPQRPPKAHKRVPRQCGSHLWQHLTHLVREERLDALRLARLLNLHADQKTNTASHGTYRTQHDGSIGKHVPSTTA